VLLVESDEAVLSYKAGIYNVRMRKRLVNRGSSPVCRFFMRIAVDRFPDDSIRSNEHYRRNLLTLDELEIEARCDGQPMALEVKHDRDAAKELWMLFHNERTQFPLYPCGPRLNRPCRAAIVSSGHSDRTGDRWRGRSPINCAPSASVRRAILSCGS
jgi:hypothetical protein